MSQGTNPTYNGEGRATLLNMIHSAPNKAELTGYKPHITGVLTSGDVADDSFLTNHLGRIYYSSLHYAGLDSLIGDSVDGSFRPITLTGLYEGTPGGGAKSISAPGASETVLMFDFEGSNNDTSTTDRSSTGHTATFNGHAKISTTQKKYGDSSLYLDGNGDYLSLADHADWTFGTGDFTWEFWVRFNNVTSSGYYILAANADSAGFFLFRWDGGGGGSGNWSYGFTAGGNNWADTLSADTWYHVAVVRSSGDIKVFRDGVEKGSAWTHTTSLDANGGINIGKSHSTEFMAGYLDDFRLTKGVARYSSNFTPPTTSHYS